VRRGRRFFEGWYYRITIPKSEEVPEGASFAFIFSIEDPWQESKRGEADVHSGRAAVQIMGPGDGYAVQSTRAVERFWAWERAAGFGCAFETTGNSDAPPTEALRPKEWEGRVREGFQALPNKLQGKVNGHDGSLSVDEGTPIAASFDIALEPASFWGDDGSPDQKSTAGWLASYSVFEPHWQVMVADGRASGTAFWNGTEYRFEDAALYVEKNWGGAFPIKWYWTQCNSWSGAWRNRRLSVTGGGGTRIIPLGATEDLGMVCVHADGKFYEAVPWTSSMTWNVGDWGSWTLSGRTLDGSSSSRPFEVELKITCDRSGVKLRAPTKSDGLAYSLKDSFEGQAELSLWDMVEGPDGNYVRKEGPPVVDRAQSPQCAVEVGGGPWWDTWRGDAKMKEPMRTMVRAPYVLERWRRGLMQWPRREKGTND